MLKNLLDILTKIAVILITLLALLSMIARVTGGGIYTIASGSMEPEYSTGSMIYVKKVQPGDLKEGDVITYAAGPDVTVTHRITGIEKDPSDPDVIWFTTKGDANEVEDAEPVDGRNVIGTPVFFVPLLGYAISFVRTPPGLYIAWAVIVALILSEVVSKRKKRAEAPSAEQDKTEQK